MNYFALHIGDYEKATAHLTAVEDGVYMRLLRRYYDTEAPIATDLKAVQRLVRARSRDEKEAVETVLEEFFELEADGWHHRRCDEEIARFQEKQEKARASANARWAKQVERSERNANASDDGMRTHSEGNALQKPIANSQERASPQARTQDPVIPASGDTSAGRACLAMRQAGCAHTNPSHPDLIAAIAEGVTPEALADTVREALEAGKAKPFTWAIATARGRLDEQSRNPTARPPGAPSHEPRHRLSAVERVEANIARARQERGEPIEGEVVRNVG